MPHPGYELVHQLPPICSDFSIISKRLSPYFFTSWTANPRPDMPAPIMRTSVSSSKLSVVTRVSNAGCDEGSARNPEHGGKKKSTQTKAQYQTGTIYSHRLEYSSVACSQGSPRDACYGRDRKVRTGGGSVSATLLIVRGKLKHELNT